MIPSAEIGMSQQWLGSRIWAGCYFVLGALKHWTCQHGLGRGEGPGDDNGQLAIFLIEGLDHPHQLGIHRH